MEKQEEGGEWSKESALNHCCSIFVFLCSLERKYFRSGFCKELDFLGKCPLRA